MKTHGQSLTPEYRTWHGMRQRCINKNLKRYPSYGGRGVKICRRWDRFENFLKDMGKRPSKEHSIDRINNEGNYTPKNCRWATRSEQQKNKSRYNPESLPRGNDHWTRKNPKKAIVVALRNIKKAHGSLEKNGNAKLTMIKAREIRLLSKQGKTDQYLIQKFNVGRETIRKVLKGILWK